MNEEYKKDLYQSYVSTHIAHRKGQASLADFQYRAGIYNYQFGRFLPQDLTKPILDIGCGNGSIVWWLQQKGYAMASGIDISPEQIAEGLKLGVHDIYEADLNEFLQTKTGHYQMIIARDVLEHFSKADVVTILQLCQRALAPSGVLIVHVPNGESPFFGRVRYGDYTHELAFTSNTIIQIGQEYGFQQVSVYPSFIYRGGTREWFRRCLWKLVQAFYKLLLFAETDRNNYIVTQNLIAVMRKSN